VELHRGKNGVELDDDDDDEVRMRDDGHEDGDLEDSVIVEKAANGEVPLPKSRTSTGL